MSVPNIVTILLRFSLEQLNAYINMCPSAILVVDSNGRITLCNAELNRRLGLRDDEIAGRTVRDAFGVQEEMDLLASRCTQAVADNIPGPVITLLASNGASLSGPIFIVPYELKGHDTPYYLIVVLEDGTLRGPHLLQRFAGTFMQDLSMGVMLLDTGFTLVDINEMACRVLGFKREDIIRKPMEDVFAAVPLEYRLVQRTILDGVVLRNHAISWMNNQEERYDLLLDTNVLRDEEGRIVGAYLIFKDVSNLRSLEEQVQRSDRLAMIGQIAAGTAHEIRNPLTSIKGFLQVLKNTFHEKEMDKEHSYTEIMLTEIDRINELVSEFLLLSKRKIVTFDEVHISHVLKEILPIIENEAILHNVTVHYDDSVHAMPKVIADRKLLKQVFLNICKNGIEAMVSGGKLTICEKVDYEERKVHVEIHDTGPGIPNFVIDKIFDPFFTTKENGTGLGLSVCQRIVHDMGGNIRVSSKGFGTTFAVCIPFP